MINGKENPVEWALLSYELDEVIEHLQEISKKPGLVDEALGDLLNLTPD